MSLDVALTDGATDFIGRRVYVGDIVAFSQRATRNTMELRLGLVVNSNVNELTIRTTPNNIVRVEPYNTIVVDEKRIPVHAKKVLRGLAGVVK